MRVNIDDKAFADTRFTFAAARLQMTRFDFLGRCVVIWFAAYGDRSAFMARRSVDLLAECNGFVEAMLAENLASAVEGDPSMVRLRGVTERVEWLVIQDAKRAKAMAAKKARAGLAGPPPGRPPGESTGRPPGESSELPAGGPYSPDLDPDLDPDQGECALSLLPEGWEPDAATTSVQASARTRGIVVEHELAKFVAHARAHAWQRADWNAAWSKWLFDSKPTSPSIADSWRKNAKPAPRVPSLEDAERARRVEEDREDVRAIARDALARLGGNDGER